MENLPIQPYDIFMLIVLVLTTIFGAWKGMAWQFASVGSLVLSSLVAMRGSGPLAPHISDNEPWNRIIAMLILFAATSLAIWLLFRLVAGVIDRVRLKEFDRQMGAILGLIKGVLFCVVITFFVVTLSETARQSVLRSKSGYYIALLVQRATPQMPQEVRDVLGKYLDELDRKLDPSTPSEAPLEEQITEHFQQRLDEEKGWLEDRLDDQFHRLDDSLDDQVQRLEKPLEETIGLTLRDPPPTPSEPAGASRRLVPVGGGSP